MTSPAVADIRRAILSVLPTATSPEGKTVEQRFLYMPRTHLKALRLEYQLVVGARGVGKSIWTRALGSPELRNWLGASLPELANVDVHTGFAADPNIDAFPDKDTFARLLSEDGTPPQRVWRAVVARWLAQLLAQDVPQTSWRDTLEWVRTQPETLARWAQQANQQCQQRQRRGLIVFDALDRAHDDWQVMDGIVRDLLRVVLWLKSFSHLGAKVFLREDQFQRTVADFPDASKLLATKAELNWAAHDLHGLLWQMLCNAPGKHGACLRDVHQDVLGTLPPEREGVWHLAEEVRRDDAPQRGLFEALAGKWMGKDKRRGVPYLWTGNHLADGYQRASPRSFLVAIREAADDTDSRHPEHPRALHYESIKRGVQKASEVRVAEMREDYPWVDKLMAPLKRLSVPCESSLVDERWQAEFPHGLDTTEFPRLPPQRMDAGWPGIRADLERLGIFQSMRDGRVNLPDLYRVGFGLGRRGGVKPLV